MTRDTIWWRRLVPQLVVLLVLLAQAEPVAAQVGTGRLMGTVRDGATGAPVVGAQVYLEGTGLGQLTDANGRFFLMNVPAGTYTVVAEFLGYAVSRRENVIVAMDAVRTVDFELTTQALAIDEVIVEAERVPLVELTSTGSRDIITAEEVEALPLTTVGEALALQHGFFEVPLDNPDLAGFMDREREMSPVHIRGGRMGENVTMVDGIPVTNFIMGDSPIELSTMAVEQMDYSRGGFEAQYGNALSGVVNIRTREPRTYYQGSLQLQSSAFGGWLGSKYDDLRASHVLNGFVSGPIPGTDDKLLFVVTASNRTANGRPYRYDDHVYRPWVPADADLADTTRYLYAYDMDMIAGWRSMGYSETRDIMTKLQYRYSPVAKLTFQVTDNESKSWTGRWNQQRVGWDLVGQCTDLYPTMEDICRRRFLGGRYPETMEDLRRQRQANQWVVLNSTARSSRLYAVNWDHTLPAARVAYNVAFGRTDQTRDSCAFAAGYCLGDRLGWAQMSHSFLMHGASDGLDRGGAHPLFGTPSTTGGDRSRTDYLRGDIQWQATDHHNLSTGFEFQRHDIYNTEGRQVGINTIQIYQTEYGGQPWDAALYVQDRIEYDFITLRLGLRFDYGRATGLFFANPQDPTNGTTAFHVCENPRAFGVPDDKFTHYDAEFDQVVTGITACALDDDLMHFAMLKAMEDDFEMARPRRALSPRLGVSFPVTESSSVFFNYGRFTQNPRYNNLYRLTGIGTPLEGTRDALGYVMGAQRRPLIGNAHLLQEQTSSYELGYVSSFADGRYGFNATMYLKDQYNLTGYRQGGLDETGRTVFDPGNTYRSATLDYMVLMNLDFQTARGVELTFRRRLENFWALDLRYAYSQVRTNAAPPELELQRRFDEGDRVLRSEAISYINRPHVGSLVLRFQVGARAPDIPFGEQLRDTQLSFTGRYTSGVPYTPQLDVAGSQSQRLERNSARAPAQYALNMQARKNFRHANMNWSAFVRVDNLLNMETCSRVYESTGRCDGGQLTRSRLETAGDGNVQWATMSSVNTPSQVWDRPDYYNPPRAISAGVTVSF